MVAIKVSRLLVLDDERIIADTMCMIANHYGYEAKAAYNHSSAIAIAHEFHPDFFLTGFNNCSDENGCETAAIVLSFLPHCRIAIFSGSKNAVPVLQDFLDRGYDFDVLAKPVHPLDFVEWMKSHGAQAKDSIPGSDFRQDQGYVRRTWRFGRRWFPRKYSG